MSDWLLRLEELLKKNYNTLELMEEIIEEKMKHLHSGEAVILIETE